MSGPRAIGDASPPSPAATIREVHYRVGGPVLGHFPGHHRSTRGNSGFEFRGHASLLDAPDPRRLDLHASLRDPFGDWRVRLYSQRQSLAVTVVADLSASMGFSGQRAKLGVLADLVESLAWSTWRTGDSFGFIGCDDAVRVDLLQPQSRLRGAGSELARRLRALHPAGRDARGLLAAPQHLGRRRALLFLVSDFHWPAELLAAVLDGLSGHELVPTVLWDPLEFGLSAARGLVQAIDPESGQQRLVWWRPALRARWQAAHAERREALLRVFRAR
ncbi:MAG TPA: MxaS protein, partial [Burkholderiaceae bacterium]